jgi:hypothetical protein
MLWDDGDRTDYFESSDPRYIVRDIVAAADASDAERIANGWVGPTCRQVGFNFIPGLFQTAFVAMVAGNDPTFWPLGFSWVVATESPVWGVRLFPNVGETAPPIGEVGFVLMPRDAIEEVWRSRGW